MNKTKIFTIIGSVTLTLLVGVVFVFADWNPAPASPPNNNAPAPINVGPNPQTKSGTLSVKLNSLDVADNFGATIRAADLNFGYSGRRGTPGRALVDLGTTLTVNYGNDWAETTINGNTTTITGNLAVDKNVTVKPGSKICLGGVCLDAWPVTTTTTSGGGYAPGQKSFITPGAYTVKICSSATDTACDIPSTVALLHVELWGGGGGGSVGRRTHNYDSSEWETTGGGGGGGGGYAARTVSVAPGDIYTVYVGAGGAGSNVNLRSPEASQVNFQAWGGTGGQSKFFNQVGTGPAAVLAQGGSGGVDFDVYGTGGQVNGKKWCTGIQKLGGTADAGDFKVNGNSGASCRNGNGDNNAGGAAIVSTTSGKSYGGGGKGRYWGVGGQASYQDCVYSACSPDYSGPDGARVDTCSGDGDSGFYSQTCTTVPAVAEIIPTTVAGNSGAVLINW